VLEGFKSELNVAGVKIPCAVISGPKGVQRVLTENGITYAILGERSGASKRLKKAASEGGALLPLFVAPSQLKPWTEVAMPATSAPNSSIIVARCNACMGSSSTTRMRLCLSSALLYEMVRSGRRAHLI
jgi:hypothetical protein